jgi:hypothetical protein
MFWSRVDLTGGLGISARERTLNTGGKVAIAIWLLVVIFVVVVALVQKLYE